MDLGDGYIGRVVLLGRTREDMDSAGFKFGGRSPESKERRFKKEVDKEVLKLRVVPLDKSKPVDPFRHYVAVATDPKTGLLVVSNGAHTTDIFDACQKRVNSYEEIMRYFLDSKWGPEVDQLRDGRYVYTPRIAGVASYNTSGKLAYCLGIVRPVEPCTRKPWITQVISITPKPGEMFFVPTYNGKYIDGDVNGVPLPFDLKDFTPDNLPRVDLPDIETPEELAQYILASCDHNFVAATIGGVKSQGKWYLDTSYLHGKR